MLRGYIAKSDRPFVRDLRRSFRNIDMEERFDLVFTRPLGLLCVRLAMKLSLRPAHVSMLSALTGAIAGILLYWRDHHSLAICASALLLFSGILDSADGQLARLTRQQSNWGRFLDGIMDNVAFQFIFWGAGLSQLSIYGPWVAAWAYPSGVLFAVQALMFDFYKNEFSFYAIGNDNDRNPTAAEIRATLDRLSNRKERLLMRLYLGYVKRFRFLVTRTGRVKIAFETAYKNARDPEAFRRQYKATYKPYLTGWALFGGMNTHRLLIVAAALLGRLDLFLIVNIFLTFPMLVITMLQARRDRAFLQNMSGTTISLKSAH